MVVVQEQLEYGQSRERTPAVAETVSRGRTVGVALTVRLAGMAAGINEFLFVATMD